MKPIYFTLLICILNFLSSTSNAQNGNYLNLNTEGYVEIKNYENIASLYTGTISFWIKPTSQTNVLFSTSNGGTEYDNNNELYIVQRGNQALQIVTFKRGVIGLDAWTSTNSFKTNIWHNVTVVFDNKEKIEVYIDGIIQPLSVGACCGGNLNDQFFSSIQPVTNMSLGRLKRENSINYSNQSSFDDFGIWNIPFTSEEVLENIEKKGDFKKCNLVVFYDFEYIHDDSPEIDLPDNSGKKHHATIYNGHVQEIYADDKIRLSEGKYIDIQNFQNISTLQQGSINFQFKVNNTSSKNMLFATTNTGTEFNDNNEFYINYRENGAIQVTGNKDGQTILDANTSPKSISDNEIHNLTIVSDKSEKIKVFIDGIEKALIPDVCCGGNTNDFFFSNLVGLNSMTLGSLQRDLPTNASYPDDVNIDNFSIWDVALSAEQINYLLSNRDYYRRCNLMLYYNFDYVNSDEYGDYYKDLSENNHPGLIAKAPLKSGISNSNKEHFKIGSNIVTERLTIASDNIQNSEVIIYDIQGTVVFQTTILSSSQIDINLAQLKNGLYVAEILSDNSASTFKFIKTSN